MPHKTIGNKGIIKNHLRPIIGIIKHIEKFKRRNMISQIILDT